jgi:hypothetical protein
LGSQAELGNQKRGLSLGTRRKAAGTPRHQALLGDALALKLCFEMQQVPVHYTAQRNGRDSGSRASLASGFPSRAWEPEEGAELDNQKKKYRLENSGSRASRALGFPSRAWEPEEGTEIGDQMRGLNLGARRTAL